MGHLAVEESTTLIISDLMTLNHRLHEIRFGGENYYRFHVL